MQAEPVTIRHRNVTRKAKFTDFHDLSHSARPILSLALCHRSSFNLVSTAIQLCAKTQAALGHFNQNTQTIGELFDSVRASGEAFERIEQIVFDVDDVIDEKELRQLDEIAIASTHSFNAINSILDSAISKGALVSDLSKRLLLTSAGLRSLMAEKQQILTSSVEQLNWLLFKVQG